MEEVCKGIVKGGTDTEAIDKNIEEIERRGGVRIGYLRERC